MRDMWVEHSKSSLRMTNRSRGQRKFSSLLSEGRRTYLKLSHQPCVPRFVWDTDE